MQAVNDDHPNTNASGPTTSHESLSSGSSSKALGTSVDSLEYLMSTSNELQNVQLKPKNFARDMEMPTKCLVCGHPANCCNYDVPSCNGCKAFFRRSLFECKTYECKLNGMCSRMHGANRCRACRFDRCVLAGMNLRAMQFPVSVDVAKVSDKVANRKRYLSQKYGERCPVLIGKQNYNVELKVRQIRESSRWLSEAVIFRSIPELLSSPENVLARADQYPKELTWPLTYDEALKIEESERRPCWISLDTFLCIEMARTMTVFSQLEYNDQKALLEHMTLANEILLEAFYSYQMKSETFIMPSGFLPTVLRLSNQQSRVRCPLWPMWAVHSAVHPSSALYVRWVGVNEYWPNQGSTEKGLWPPLCLTACGNCVGDVLDSLPGTQQTSNGIVTSKFEDSHGMTMEEFVLLKAIIYSHSTIHGLSERGRVLLEKESIRYSRTLMKHLQSRLGAAPGAKKYAEIVFFISCLFYGAQQLRGIHIYISTVRRFALVPSELNWRHWRQFKSTYSNWPSYLLIVVLDIPC
ncbi:zinc finger, c4 type (two domains) domain-containing protein [Ditylenchus destructor]|uniref:Zinc finger, c4 type (Two domains) domain-containing protein n=1 Tax=Ditylenchus destructor TaxID=166010 RepID=A0AAD4MLI0_9BILA|nr:zinc finger, c4 type (two domains) domain-containing protein [Ditylenchus destructor]